MTDLRRRRSVATPDAGRAHHAYPGTGSALQFLQQFFGAQHGAGQRIADPNGQRRNVRLAFLHHVEMRVEGRRLEHLREGQLHLVGKRRQMRGRNLVVGILDQMQMLDQQIAPPRPVAKQKRNLFSGLRIDLAALGGRFGALAPLARMLERANLLHVMTHRNISFPHPCPATLVRGIPNAKREMPLRQGFGGMTVFAVMPQLVIARSEYLGRALQSAGRQPISAMPIRKKT